jgi:cytochrome c oxidase assembly factor CtaG
MRCQEDGRQAQDEEEARGDEADAAHEGARRSPQSPGTKDRELCRCGPGQEIGRSDPVLEFARLNPVAVVNAQASQQGDVGRRAAETDAADPAPFSRDGRQGDLGAGPGWAISGGLGNIGWQIAHCYFTVRGLPAKGHDRMLIQHWSLDPFIVIAALLVGLNELGLRRLETRSKPEREAPWRLHSLAFYGGLILLILAVASPIDYWADKYFFIHMIQHILIMFFAPILIVLGAPWHPLLFAFPLRVRRAVGRAVMLSDWARPVRALGRFLNRGVVAVVVFNLVMVAWHLPPLFDWAQWNQVVHIWLMHSSFFLAGVFFWLQIIPSFPIKPKLTALGQIWAIVMTNVVMIVLAMSMSIFSSSSWYSVYNHVPGVTLAPFADQQIGAAILWVCGDFWAIPALVYVIRQAIQEVGGGEALIDAMLRGRAKPGPPGEVGE